MLNQEGAVEIMLMACQGKGAREIARELGLSRNTVSRYLRGTKPAYTGRPQGV